MAAYDYVPPEKMAPKKAAKKARPRSQKPGHPADNPAAFAEMPFPIGKKKAAPVSKRQQAASNLLDKKNKAAKVGEKDVPRATVAKGARKASTPSTKPNPTDKKVRGKTQK